jgi:hypothetical protein
MVPSLFSCTFDAWTSKAYDSYLSVMVHYIYSPPSNPANWELKAEVLGLTQIHGSHSSANLGSTFLGVIDRYGIQKQVWFPKSFSHTCLICSTDGLAYWRQCLSEQQSTLFLQWELLRPDWRAKTHHIRYICIYV